MSLEQLAQRQRIPKLVPISLNGFSKPWDSFVCGIVAREKLPNWQRLWDDFVQDEIRLGHPSGSFTVSQVVDENALALTSIGKGKPKKKGSEKKKNIDFSKVKYFQCHKFGHFASQCPKNKKSKPQMAASTRVEEFAKSFGEDCCLIACMSSSIVTDVWYVGSGIPCHMTGHKDFFISLREGGVNLHIELGDDARYKAQGRGTLTFQRELGKSPLFADVLYVPDLTNNLILVSTLEDKGFEVTFYGGKVYIRPKGSTTKMGKMIGVRSEQVYRLHFEPAKALVSSSTDLGELWHRQMTHLHFGAFGHLRQIVTGMPQIAAEKHDPCKGCALGKYVRKAFPSSEHRSKGILDLIHSDACGPMSVQSVSGFSYYMIFIDDYSRKTWIYFLKTKDEAFYRFREFRALVENQSGRRIRVLGSDNGGAYTSNEFVEYCVVEGIKKELTVPYNPQQNGVAERKNRTIVGATHAMIHD
jgi:hypothetical protein